MDSKRMLIGRLQGTLISLLIKKAYESKSKQPKIVCLTIDDVALKLSKVKLQEVLKPAASCDEFIRQVLDNKKIEYAENKMNIRKSYEKTRLVLKKFCRQMTKPSRFKR